MPGSAIFRHQSQPRTRRLVPTSRSSDGKAEAPAITLKSMYHCVPRIMRGLSQMSGFSRKATIAETATGKSRLAGKAARN